MKNFLLVILSLAVTLGAAEVGMRALGRGPLPGVPGRHAFWRYDSVLGWAHQPGQQGVFEHLRLHTNVRINSKGLRDTEKSYDRTGAQNRALVLGDSFAWGYGVEQEERFSERLASSLGVEIINAGVSGYSTDQELLWYEGEGIKYDVDLVIVVFCGNDERYNHRKLVYYLYPKPWYAVEGNDLVLNGVPVPHVDWLRKTFFSLRRHSGLAAFVGRRINSRFDLDEVKTDDDTSYDVTVALLREMRRMAATHGDGFMIVSAYEWEEGAKSSRGLSDRLRTDGFLVLEVEKTPGWDAEKMMLEMESHWNPAGHAFVAQAMQDFISSNDLLPGDAVGRTP